MVNSVSCRGRASKVATSAMSCSVDASKCIEVLPCRRSRSEEASSRHVPMERRGTLSLRKLVPSTDRLSGADPLLPIDVLVLSGFQRLMVSRKAVNRVVKTCFSSSLYHSQSSGKSSWPGIRVVRNDADACCYDGRSP